MFSFGGSVDKQDQIMGMFELPARHKLLEAKRATRRNRELSQLCDKCDDLVALTAELSRMLLRYVEKQLPDSVIEETQEYEKLKNMLDIDFESFRLIKYVMIEHFQRTESASQLVDILESLPEKTRKADAIHAALEIAMNREDYSAPRGANTDMLRPALRMTDEEFDNCNEEYESILKRVEGFMCRRDHTEREKYDYLAQLMTSSRRSRIAKTMILVRAWDSIEKSNILRSMQKEIGEQIETLRARETPLPTSSIEPLALTADVEAIHNGLMEERLERLLSGGKEEKGENE
ncbi:MAG: hypothetical protein IJ418_15465 [Clostridia bacterium]|nr:hypothetical protein [Clostridia bacterium]